VSRFPRAYRRQLEAQDSAKVDRIVRESSSEDVGYVAGATSRGDALRLRGLPAIGRGTSGAIRGTRPGENLWRS
jgi:hypothetical protein